MEESLLGREGGVRKQKWRNTLLIFLAFLVISALGLVIGVCSSNKAVLVKANKHNDIVESEKGVVAADDGRCSEVGASMLRNGGHAVDAAVATALCLGVVNPMSSGIGGGGFMIVRSASTSKVEAYDMRETAPAAASEDMYENNPETKSSGSLSMGVPGELAGLHRAWLRYGRLPWQTLVEPAIHYAKNGFVISAYLGDHIEKSKEAIMSDPGLTAVFAPNRKLLRVGDTCQNLELARALEAVAEQGPEVLYNGKVGEKLVKDVRERGGILSMEDLRKYKVNVIDALAVDVMGYTIFGMPPPSSGTLGLALIMNILDSYGSTNAAAGPLGLHRLIEATKHMLAVRMNLGDPAYVDVSPFISKMTSRSFASELRRRIFDNTTFPSSYYLSRWSQVRDNGTSHFCIVDAERNAVSLTTTVNYVFGARVLSPSTGIVLNNEMDDFSTPTESRPDKLPPAPSNFIAPGKRPLSSMTPLIIVKDNQLVGVVGGSGGLNIIAAVTQVFLNHFVLGMEPLVAVQNARVYHRLFPNVVYYENLTAVDGDHIELSEKRQTFLKERGHELVPRQVMAVCQLIVQKVESSIDMGRKYGKGNVIYGTLTAVSDPRKDGKPAAM